MLPLFSFAIIINLPFVGMEYGPPCPPATDSSVTFNNAETEKRFLGAYFIFAMVHYFRWAFLVIDKICTFLDINCFTIKKPAEKKN